MHHMDTTIENKLPALSTFGLIVLSLSIFAATTLYAQTPAKFNPREGNSFWTKMSKITFKKTTDQFGDYNAPVYSEEVKALEGKEISLSGYMVPADGLKGVFRPEHFILSSLPLEACYFCGTGGAETVIEVYSTKPIKYTTDPVKLKGKLLLNYNDPYQLIYILEDAEFVEVAN
jgi:hypothetical protein